MEEQIKINAVTSNLKDVELFFNSIFKTYHIPRKIYCKIYLAVTEGVTNGIIHGNKQNANKFVKVIFQDKEDYYLIAIKDQGEGFDFNNLPDPTDPSNLKKESGRGIFIMKQYADRVEFLDSGSWVNLIFNK